MSQKFTIAAAIFRYDFRLDAWADQGKNMHFKSLATQIVMSKISSANNSSNAESALDSLVGESKGFDLGKLVDRLQVSGSDLATKTKSWLGDGENLPVSPSELQNAIGNHGVAAFAKKLGIDRREASARLAEILPELIDKSSQGGRLLGATGDSRGLTSFAAKFFRKTA